MCELYAYTRTVVSVSLHCKNPTKRVGLVQIIKNNNSLPHFCLNPMFY